MIGNNTGLNPEAVAGLLLEIAAAVGVDVDAAGLAALTAANSLDLTDWAAPDSSTGGANAVRLKLEVPITLKLGNGQGDRTDHRLDSLLIGRPRAMDIDALTGRNELAGMRRALLAILKREPDQALLQAKHIDEMDAADLMRAVQVVTDFFPKPRSRRTGGSLPAN